MAANDNALADFLRAQKEEELRIKLIKDPAATSMYERQIITEEDENGKQSIREMDMPKAVPEWLINDWATTNFSRKDKSIKICAYQFGLTLASIQAFMEGKGLSKDGKYSVDMNPTLLCFRNLLAMLLLSEKANDGDLVNKFLRQHVKQESIEYLEQKIPKGGMIGQQQQF